MVKKYTLPLTACVGGAVGFGLRMWELTSAFDHSSGLAKYNAPASTALIGCSLGIMALLLLLGVGKFGSVYHCDHAFESKKDRQYFTMMVFAGFIMMAGGIANLITTPQAYDVLQQAAAVTHGNVQLFFLVPRVGIGLLALGSGWGFLSMGKRNYYALKGNQYSLSALLPAYTACLMLITVYQNRSGDPVVLDYVYELLACVGCVMGTYLLSGFYFENAKGYPTLVGTMAATYLIFVTLADNHEIYLTLIFIGYALYFLASNMAIVANSEKPRPRKVVSRMVEDPLEDFDLDISELIDSEAFLNDNEEEF